MATHDDSQAGDSEEFLHLGAWLRRSRERILDAWEHAASMQPKARRLSRAELLNHLPQLVDRIAHGADKLERDEPAPISDHLPSVHAIERLNEGYDLGDVAAEYALLRECILRMLEDELRPWPHGELVLLNQTLDAAITHSVKSYSEARERTLVALDRVTSAAFVSTNASEFLPKLLDAVLETCESVDAVTVLLREGMHLRVTAAVGLTEEREAGFTLAIGEGFAGTIAATHQPLFLTDAAHHPLVRSRFLREAGVRALYGVPLLSGDDLIGVAHIGSRTAFDFSNEDRLLFRAMATRATELLLQAQARDREQRAHEALREQQDLYESLLLAMSDLGEGLCIIDGHRLLFANDAFCRLFQYSIEELLELPDTRQLLSPEERPGVDERLEQARSGRKLRHHYETRGLRRDGQPLDLEVSFKSLGGSKRIVICRDITSQREARRLLERSEARFRALVYPGVVGFFTWLREGPILEANDAFLQMTGYDRRDLDEGRLRWDTVTSPESLPAARRSIELALKEGASPPFEKQFMRKDGTRVDVLVGAAPLEAAREEGIAVVVDITDRKRAERALREREEAYRVLAESSPHYVWTTSPEGKLTYASDKLTRYLGADQSNNLDFDWDHACHPDDVAAARAKWMRSLESGEPFEAEYRLRRHDGAYRWFMNRADPVHGHGGEINMWSGTSADVHELHLARERLSEALTFQERLMAILGHDLRNPLSAIRMGATLLLRQDGATEATLRTAGRIDRAAIRMQTMIKDVLDFAQARLEGTLPLTPGPCRLNDVVEEALQELESAYPSRAIRFESREDVRGTWDASRLAQVVSNLVGNALTHGDPTAPVIVALERTREMAMLRVENQGQPIPAETLAHIFEPFRRAPPTAGSRAEGLGLGLFIVREIVRAHGGEVQVTSSESGTAFTVRLPPEAPRDLNNAVHQ